MTAVVAALLVPLAGAPAADAAPRACYAANTTQGLTYGPTQGSSFQSAIFAAQPGDRLTVSGRCNGNYFVDRDLTIVGKARPGYPRPILNGRARGPVLSLTSATSGLVLRDVAVRNGAAEFGAGIVATEQIDQDLLLELAGSTIVADNAGWGVQVTSTASRIVLNDTASIRRNAGTGLVATAATVVLNDSARIADNTGELGGGVANYDGRLVMRDSSSIVRNSAVRGGGFYSDDELGSLAMSGQATIAENRARLGGGVFTLCALDLTTLEQSSITANRAVRQGGGTWGTSASNVFANRPDDVYEPVDCFSEPR